jgi:hypothetical protein
VHCSNIYVPGDLYISSLQSFERQSNGHKHDLWRAVNREGEVLESFATQSRDEAAALKLKKRFL